MRKKIIFVVTVQKVVDGRQNDRPQPTSPSTISWETSRLAARPKRENSSATDNNLMSVTFKLLQPAKLSCETAFIHKFLFITSWNSSASDLRML